MSPPKVSVNKKIPKKSIDRKSRDIREILKEEDTKSVTVQVKVLEPPLMIFVCPRCSLNFDTTESYQLHECTAPVFTIVQEEIQQVKESNDTNGDTIIETKIIDSEDILKEKPKKQRKPYKKRDKAAKNDEPKATVSCENCGKVFTRKYHLERHLTHTQCNPGTFVKAEHICEVCNKVFSRIDNLRMHLRAHLGVKSRSRDFQCPYCEKAFYGSSLLNIHIRSHTKEKPYLCEFMGCGKGFPSSGALTKHRRTHTGEKPYCCGVCGNRFAAKETLNRHVKTHTGKKDHVCRICGKSFIQNTQLKAHLFHHTGENAYCCDLCGKKFNRKTRLREHIEYIHLKYQMPSCNFCSKPFIRREDLNRHIESHIGERNHVCGICDKKFVTKAAARIHMRIHQVEDPARCSYCNKDFLRMDCLVRHVRSKHREMLQQIIVEAETNRILSAQRKVSNAGDFEIIIYNEDFQDDDSLYEVVDEKSVKSDPDIKKEKAIEITCKITSNPVKEIEEVEDDDDDECAPIFLDDDLLMKRIEELLQVVIEESLLKDLGFGAKPIDEVLCSVLEQCSHKPLRKGDSDQDDSTRMRENTKQLFSMVLDEDHIKSLLNNYTVDEVITIVLKMSK